MISSPADSRTDKKVADIVDQLVKHCDQSANQQHDDQFVLYSVSYLDNLATSQQPEHKEAKEAINANKQHFMKIRLLSKKFNKELGDVRKYSRNYKLDQVFNQIDSGLNLEGDIIYESQHKKQQQQQKNINLPKLMRFNMSMPVMGETVNVLEVAIRQNAMDEELLGALKIVQKSQLSSQTISKVADSFKSQIEKQQQQQPQQQWQKQQQQNAEADLTIKVDGCTVVYMCADDFKSSTGSSSGQKRNTRSTHNIVDELIQHLKQSPVSFNRGINFSLNERLAKVLDVEANMVAGLRFESRASGQSSDNFEIVVKAEPRFAFESIVGPAKLSSKKLLQRFSTKTAVAVRLAFKADQLVDLQVNLPMDDMELFTYQSKIVEKSADAASIYDVADYYTTTDSYDMDSNTNSYNKMKRSLLSKKSSSKSLSKLMSSGKSFSHSFETPEEFAQATGLRSKLRIVASPKDMSFFVQAVCQKTDSAMQGYRVKVEKVERSAGQKQYLVSVSTPGSRQDRTLQMRVVKQTSAGRSIFKTDVQSPKMAAEMKAEIVHDGRQYSVKVELASTRGKQWRHALEAGVQRGSQQQSGRVATTYKPYLSVDSSSIRRPVQMQGVVSYQQSPKSVISYELKCSNTGDFVQGKIIIDSRHSNAFAKRSTSSRRSMSSPLELVFQKDLTFTQETTAQVGQHAYKVHKMLDWDANKQALNADASFQHKNLRKSRDSQTIVSLQLDQERQVAKVERKCPQDDRKDFKLYIASDKKSQGTAAHQLVAELRYNGKRSASQQQQQQQPGNLQSVAFYKHQVELHQSSRKSAQISYTVELNASELRFNEKLSGSAQVNFDRKQKTLKTEMSSRNKSAKIDVDYESLGKHQIDVVFQSERLSHRCNVRADQRQYSLQSRTESRNQNIAKIVLEIQKQQGECQLVVELPTKAVHYAADLKLQSGKTSSVAVQTPRFSSNVQFTFDTAKRAFNANKRVPSWAKPYLAARAFESLRFKSDLKDTMNKQAYWIDSNIDTRGQSKSYLRFDTPIYRSDLEYQPEQRDVKFGLFARSKRSISANDYAQLYSTDDSLLSEPMDSKLNLGSSKLWMIRSMISSPSQLKQAQEAVRRALFEYADRRQSHKHSVNWRPLEERLNIDYERQPSAEYENQLKPIRFNADIVSPSAYYNIFRNQHQQQKQQQQANRRPSTMSFDSENLDFGLDYDIKSPFDSQDEYNSYAKFNAQSRYPRSLFSKHESEIRYSNKHGYKGHVKHQDADKKHHSLRFEADQSPKKYAKIDYESDKHGKGQYSHDWHKTQAKRNSEQEYYTNQVSFNAQSPRSAAKDWSHQTKLSWDEPMRKMNFRERRSIHHSASDELAQVAADAQRRYNAIDYLKHLNANLNSQTYRNQNQLYKLDFDYKPESHARLNMVLPGDMLHSSAIEYEPTERLYKLRSKMLNQRTQLPSYELLASTKPVVSELATADQEPVFINVDHPMLERPISQRLAANLFRQPLKLDYSDMYGRRATFDFDQSPLDASVAKYAGLRQKRAALYYKNDQQDFEHNSSLDFYPQAFYGGMKKSSQAIAGDYAFKTETKYGPVMVVVNSDNQSSQLKMKSPLVNAQITVDESTGRRQAQIVKIDIDNKDQRVRLAKIVRNELPAALRKLDFVQQIANTIDNSRFEHQTEMLVSVVEAIFKIKSQTRVNQRQVLTIDGELDKQQNKLYAKIDGERTKGQLVADLINKSLDLSVDTDDKRTFQHQTRLVRTSDKYYSLDSVTSYKQQPLFKLSGKVSAMIFSEPEHLFSRRSSSSSAAYTEDHISSFEAVLYGKKPTQISAQYDCLKKEANFVFENLAEKKVQVTSIKYDERSETVVVNAQLSSPYGRVYTSQAKLNLPGLMKSSKCRSSAYSCQSELMYSEKSGLYSAKYEPNQYLAVKTPYGQQTVKLY